MVRTLLTIFLTLLLTAPAISQSYGLAFNSHESVPEKRTGLELTPGDSLCFSGKLRVAFDMNFISGNHVYFGYLLRILNNGENIDLVYDQRARLFRITVGKKFSGISFPLDSAHLYYQWNKISILIDPSAGKMELGVNGKTIGSSAISMAGGCFKFLWGANDYESYQTRDIPPMRVREIQLFENADLKYHWPLNNITGNSSLDEIHQKKALIKNAVWIRPGHQNWEMTSSFIVQGNAVAAFDKKNDRLYIAGSDSIFIYDAKRISDPWIKLSVEHENILPGSQGVYDTVTDRLYSIFIDQKKVAAYQLNAPRWDVSFDSALTEYWHPNKFISPFDTSLYTIGGYGQLKYKNVVHRYHLATKQWETITPGGTFFPPRYLSALGMNERGDTAYIMGGYGSPTGDQMLNPAHYFDLFTFDVKSRRFNKLFDLDSIHTKFTFANSLVIDSKNQQYYGLIFPNDSFNSNLHLIRGSLKDRSFQLLGNELPYSFYDIQSFADLYYSPKAGKLIAVTFFYVKPEGKDKFTTVKVYTIDFPPEYLEPAAPARPFNKPLFFGGLLLLVAALTGGLIWVYKKKVWREKGGFSYPQPAGQTATTRQEDQSALPYGPRREEEEEEIVVTGPRIYLFGQFRVFDKDGVDISNLFTPVLRELFLLILIYTFKDGRGISAEELTEVLWTEKPVKDAKNNRSVNMAKLKSILERMGEGLLVKQSGFWQFTTAESPVYVDYQKYLELPRHHHEIKGEHLKDLLRIIKKGAFLIQTEYNWLDDTKVEVSNAVIETCLHFLRAPHDELLHPEFVIEIANCIFQFDQLNEDALEYKCRSLLSLKRLALANKTFAKFAKDYKDIYGEEFNKSFNEIINTGSPDPLHR